MVDQAEVEIDRLDLPAKGFEYSVQDLRPVLIAGCAWFREGVDVGGVGDANPDDEDLLGITRKSPGLSIGTGFSSAKLGGGPGIVNQTTSRSFSIISLVVARWSNSVPRVAEVSQVDTIQ